MSRYYVSQQRGNDENSGLSPLLPWKTITKALEVTANDEMDVYIYIGPGTYREQLTLQNGGVDETHRIIYLGDPDVQYVIGDKPGIVRLTSSDENDFPLATDPGTVYTITFNNQPYVEFWNFYIDGNYPNRTIVLGNSGIDGQTLRNCRVSNRVYGFTSVSCYNCTSLSGLRGFHDCDTYNCIAVGGQAGFYGGNSYNCLSLGSYNGFQTGTAYNCIAAGCGSYGFNTVTHTNCFSIYCSTGTTGGSAVNFTHSSSIAGASTAPLSLFNIDFENILRGGMADGGTFFFRDSKDLLPLPDKDFSGSKRTGGDGTIDIGPWELSGYKLDWSSFKYNAPSVRVDGTGEIAFKFPVEAGKPVIKSCWIKSGLDSYLDEEVLPIITDYRQKGFTVSASTEYSTTYPAWKAFNKTNVGSSDGWITANNIPFGWLQISSPSKLIVTKYTVTNRNWVNTANYSGSPKDWTLEASDDGETWVVLHAIADQSGWINNETREFIFENSSSYKYHRLNVSANNGGAYLNIGMFKLYGSLDRSEYIRPKIVAKGLGHEIERVAIKNRGEWEHLAVYLKPSISGVMELVLSSQDENVGAYTLFSDVL